MPSERVQRQVDRLLDEAEAAVAGNDWPRVRELAASALRLDPAELRGLTGTHVVYAVKGS